MIIEKFSSKALSAVEEACRLAVKKEHSHVTPWHLLYILLEEKSSYAQNYLSQAGADLDALKVRVNSQLIAQPKAGMSSQETPINRDLERIFIHSEEFVSTNSSRNFVESVGAYALFNSSTISYGSVAPSRFILSEKPTTSSFIVFCLSFIPGKNVE